MPPTHAQTAPHTPTPQPLSSVSNSCHHWSPINHPPPETPPPLFPPQQLQLPLRIQPARRTSAVALGSRPLTTFTIANSESALLALREDQGNHARRGNAAMAQEFRRERVVAEGAADRGRGGV